jgi:hypothetical protein
MTIGTVHETLKIGNKGLYFKHVNIKLRKMLREVDEALIYLDSAEDMIHYANLVRKEIDAIDLESFKVSSAPEENNEKNKAKSGVTPIPRDSLNNFSSAITGESGNINLNV